MIFRLVRAGYGSYHEVSRMNAREVIQAIHYENFCGEYEDAYIELNKG